MKQFGKSAEERFNELLEKHNYLDIRRSTNEEDRLLHIDYFATHPVLNKEISFDVKAHKKLNRHDKEGTNDFIWLELKNNYGYKGWLHGKANFIAFETGDSWLIVNRIKLINLVKLKCKDLKPQRTKEVYKVYRRYGQKDAVVLALTEDIKQIANNLRPKDDSIITNMEA